MQESAWGDGASAVVVPHPWQTIHAPLGYRLDRWELAKRQAAFLAGTALVAMAVLFVLCHVFIFGHYVASGQEVPGVRFDDAPSKEVGLTISEAPIVWQSLRMGLGDGTHTPYSYMTYRHAPTAGEVAMAELPMLLLGVVGSCICLARPGPVAAAVGFSGFAAHGFMWNTLVDTMGMDPGHVALLTGTLWTFGIVVVAYAFLSLHQVWRPQCMRRREAKPAPTRTRTVPVVPVAFAARKPRGLFLVHKDAPPRRARAVFKVARPPWWRPIRLLRHLLRRIPEPAAPAGAGRLAR